MFKRKKKLHIIIKYLNAMLILIVSELNQHKFLIYLDTSSLIEKPVAITKITGRQKSLGQKKKHDTR